MRLLIAGLVLALFSGCESKEMCVFAINASGQEFEQVTISGSGKSIEFGVLVDGGTAGHMTAGRVFGKKFPESLTIQFSTKDGNTFAPDVTLKNEPTRNLTVTIDADLNAIGTFD